MKITDLLNEAKFSKQKGIVYHGTDLKHLRSIIKQGLIVNKSEGGYGSYGADGSEEYSPMGYSYMPHQGVYFTKDFREARDIAIDVSDNDNAGMVVAIELQPREVLMDEDRILEDVLNVSYDMSTKLSAVRRGQLSKEEKKEQIGKLRTYFFERAKNNLDRYLLKLFGNNEVSRQKVSDAAWPQVKRIIMKVTSREKFIADSPRNNPNNIKADIREEQAALIKALKHAAIRDPRIKSAMIPKNITFSGATKIIGIALPGNGYYWGDVFNQARGPNSNDGWVTDPRKQVKTPIELVNKVKVHEPW